MTVEKTKAPVVLADLPGITAREGEATSLALAADLVTFLEGLTAEEWAAVTPCDPWTVKDVAAHLLGWCDALCSPRAFGVQARAALARRKRFGNLLDAHNDAQVELARDVSTEEVLDRLRVMTPKAAKLRRRLGASLHYVPAYAKFLGGTFNLGYLMNSVFPRDLIVHTLDVAQATGRDAPLGDAAGRIAADMLRDWARRTGADATVELTGPAGGVYVAGDGRRATITGSTGAVVHRLAGRTPSTPPTLGGDVAAAERWLAAGCPV
ncbi:MAG TPA: maleylpyruvate isomerase family mycothiol-dependent enzyme [Actinomycetota bacterium]|nr:maleylpyruvate isomerase family mycothiol-dependent enzyme [Actinomycetota bacterium]